MAVRLSTLLIRASLTDQPVTAVSTRSLFQFRQREFGRSTSPGEGSQTLAIPLICGGGCLQVIDFKQQTRARPPLISDLPARSDSGFPYADQHIRASTGHACLRERFASPRVTAQRTWCDIFRLGLRLWKVLTGRPISHAGLFKWYALGGRQRLCPRGRFHSP
jgi:hypothetical protein